MFTCESCVYHLTSRGVISGPSRPVPRHQSPALSVPRPRSAALRVPAQRPHGHEQGGEPRRRAATTEPLWPLRGDQTTPQRTQRTGGPCPQPGPLGAPVQPVPALARSSLSGGRLGDFNLFTREVPSVRDALDASGTRAAGPDKKPTAAGLRASVRRQRGPSPPSRPTGGADDDAFFKHSRDDHLSQGREKSDRLNARRAAGERSHFKAGHLLGRRPQSVEPGGPPRDRSTGARSPARYPPPCRAPPEPHRALTGTLGGADPGLCL
ncbi:unnamed protein product [Gadus morhua 'NCC']